MSRYRGKRFVVCKHVVARKMGEEIVFLNLQTQHYYSVGGPGVMVWELIQGGDDFESIIRKCRETYEEGSDPMEESVEEFISDLEAEQFVSVQCAEGTFPPHESTEP